MTQETEKEARAPEGPLARWDRQARELYPGGDVEDVCRRIGFMDGAAYEDDFIKSKQAIVSNPVGTASPLVTKWKGECNRRTVTLDEIVADVTRAALEQARDAMCPWCGWSVELGDDIHYPEPEEPAVECRSTPIRILLAALPKAPE